MFGEEIVDILDIDIRYLRDMDETRLAFRQFYESTEIRDARDNTLNYIANFNGQINSSSLSRDGKYTLYYNLARSAVSRKERDFSQREPTDFPELYGSSPLRVMPSSSRAIFSM